MSKRWETKKAYLERGMNLWKRACRHHGVHAEELQAHLFVDWLVDQLSGFLPATRRQYLASAKELLSSVVCPGPSDNRDSSLKRLELLNSTDFSGEEKKVRSLRRTSRQKSKKITKEDILELIDAFKKSNGKWDWYALNWLMSNSILGLRPNEWCSVKLDIQANGVFLIVSNSKYGQGRSNGPFRKIKLTCLDEIERKIIIQQIKISRKFSVTSTEWKKFYLGCKNALYQTTRKIWPGRQVYPTLSSGRHQFSADAKASGLTKEEVAALLGHSSILTAFKHYAGKKNGNSGLKVRPSEEDVERLRGHEASDNVPVSEKGSAGDKS